jgi:type IV pilus assembly protein PilB
MKINSNVLRGILLMNKVVDAARLSKLEKESTELKVPLDQLVVEKKLTTERDLVKLYARSISVPYVDLSDKLVPRNILTRIPERIAKKSRAVLFSEENEKLLLAMEDPDDFQALDFIEKQTGYRVKVYIATPSDISQVLDQYKEGLDTEISKAIKDTHLNQPKEELEDGTSKEKVQEIIEDAPIARTVSIILEYAVKSRASDVHIEPREDAVHIRYRIDGVLQDTMTLPKTLLSAVVSRIKILADLKIDEHRIPQDGRFKITVAGKRVALRVSTLPIMDGEKVVMRLLDESTKAATLEELGFIGQSLAIIKDNLLRAHGMTLVTGPTGSGKSTTLYSILSSLNTVGVNISTVEDPVEYRIQGVNQTQANEKVGMTFAGGLRSLLRQDPDIIMVGEIRDGETAELAVQAALTGHIVLSTLHTNSAAGSLPRLIDMKVEPFLISSTVNTIIAQRLVRRVCVHCMEMHQLTEAEMKALGEEFDIAGAIGLYQKLQLKRIPEAPQAPEPTATAITLFKGKGCDKCAKSGYQGRKGIYEVLGVTEAIGEMIVQKKSSDEIQNEAVKEGMILMHQDGFLKALQGITTVEEVLRATKE